MQRSWKLYDMIETCPLHEIHRENQLHIPSFVKNFGQYHPSINQYLHHRPCLNVLFDFSSSNFMLNAPTNKQTKNSIRACSLSRCLAPSSNTTILVLTVLYSHSLSFSLFSCLLHRSHWIKLVFVCFFTVDFTKNLKCFNQLNTWYRFLMQ